MMVKPLKNGLTNRPARSPHSASNRPGATKSPPRQPERIQRPPSDSGEPAHIAIPADAGGLRIRDWLDLVKEAMDGRPEAWRRRWLELHQQELADLRSMRPDWADRVEAAAIAPDLPQEDAA
jgi:hypothetical protein